MTGRQRQHCDKCGFIDRQCVCQFIRQARVPQRVIIIQDQKEASHAKNTVGLLSLALPQIEVIKVQVDEDVSSYLTGFSPDDTALLHPSEHAEVIESLDVDRKFGINTLVVIDATWRRAKRILLSNPSLQKFPALTFGQTVKSVYSIRKAPSAEDLSTFEAGVYALEQLNNIRLEPLVEFMARSIDWQWRDQPKEHRHN
ncbi:DTW domain-containing protein [Marinomonas mediterranea]|jgi:Uncharacterized conserved protein|uniref:tRNA-uridine aminocarboxypropyltransferase n=1 Tax=Marinomonas mediterranea (strain ATCC 700492 / JCM 21426 / NBRC 103028 / MMB-1) TaxID=717774 RepID=F2JY26_MARM1|nr:tRNA-uridine aminocarboxypropyltransferase [Marinomonas mediterranea]ADZ90762.1 DTW domain containing protein [Marinomonas mediterranea MMB-1]WCN12849.1 DTW domain-containing protein [Marinomonas mediterranea]WCN16917.1 DTW domain-containing protein [Marinomonas mediterranea MMB-1]